MVEVLKDSYPTARKEHHCQLCGGVIKKGERYHRQSCVLDGQAYDFINHTKCEKIASKLDMFGRTWSDGVDSGVFDEFVWDAIEYLHPDREEAQDMDVEQRVNWLMDHKDLVDEYMK